VADQIRKPAKSQSRKTQNRKTDESQEAKNDAADPWIKVSVMIRHSTSIKLSAVSEANRLGRGEYASLILTDHLRSARISHPKIKPLTEVQKKELAGPNVVQTENQGTSEG
jgi:uncharacterized protein HemY